ncbi:MAG: toll/interleukin-1 receptor domain-containing protein [Ktedonobacteraceae bacterium]
MTQSEHFDVFLSHSHVDAQWVEELAGRLEDQANLRVWLDKWVLIPGGQWQQALVRGLDQVSSCAVCIGEHTPTGWCREEMERALNRQTKDPSFRVIPVLLPNARKEHVDNFLELRTWVDFGKNNLDYAFHLLVSGIKGEPPGRWPPQ